MATLEDKQSQLDWLWQHYSDLDVDDLVSASEVEKLIAEATEGYITTLKWTNSSSDEGILAGYDDEGNLVASVTIPVNPYITQTEVTEDSIVFTLSNGNELTMDLSQYVVSVDNTNTVTMDITDNVITSNVRLGVQSDAITLKKTSNGLAAVLNLASQSSIVFDTEGGLSGYFSFQDGDAVEFYKCTMAQYLRLTPVDGTIYFIYDQPCIYLDGVQYAIASDEIKDIIQAYLILNYNSDDTKLELLNSDGDVITSMDATPFIKDGLLDSVSLEVNPDGQEEGTYFHFVFNTDAKKEDIYLDVSLLDNIYIAGTGISITDNVISINEEYVDLIQEMNDSLIWHNI